MIKGNIKRTLLIIIAASMICFVNYPSNQLDLGYNTAYAQKAKKKRRRRVRRFALNFKDVDISEFLGVMSQLIGKNIVTDDKVRGKVTISSARRVPVSQAYDIMKSILELKGLAVVETKNLIKVVPIGDAMRQNVKVIVDGKVAPARDDTITFLYKVKKSDADEIANSLKSLKSKNTQIVLYRSLNTIIFSGMSSEIRGLVKIATALDREIFEEGGPERGGLINVVHLENANAEDLANVLSRIPFSDTARINTSPISKRTTKRSAKSTRLTKRQTTVPQKKSKLSIIANKDTNSLIITARPDEFREIQRVIRKLDIVREQVLIEALIVEVNAESGWGFGIDWMLGQKLGGFGVGGSSINSGVPNFSSPEGLTDKSVILPLATGFQLGFLADSDYLSFALLNATATDNNFKILSTPQILTVDNHEAELNVGEEIAVPTNTRITDQGNTFQTFDYKAVGIKLKITPHITKKKKITLDLYQEVNNIIGETTILDGGSVIPPKLGKRDIKTKITVNDGKTIVVGGLMRNNKTVEVTKVPLLGDIPLLGWLFKRKTVSYLKSNLLVFITPRIVTKQETIDAITKQKRDSQRLIIE